MIPQATGYDFTTISTPGCISGAPFGDAMCPRLEQILWLNEAVRTAECRGGFNPLTGDYPTIGTKNDPATMFPKPSALADFQTRINAVLTVPYHDLYSLPSGVLSAFSLSASMPNATVSLPSGSYIGTAALSSACESAKVFPQAVAFSQFGMWPKRAHLTEYSAAAERGTSAVLLTRSAVYGTSYASSLSHAFRPGLDSVLQCSSREWRRDGAAGRTPMQDWNSGDYPNPFLDEYGNDYDYNTDHSVADYYRVKSDVYDTVYSRETATWTLPVGLPPWTYTGTRGLAAQKRTLVTVQLVWRVLAAPLWKRRSDGVYVRDKTVSGWVWAGEPRRSWVGVLAIRTRTGLDFQFTPGGSIDSIVKAYGDHILSETLVESSLASSGVMGGTSADRVGYVAHVFCIGGVFVGLTAERDIGI